MPINLDDLIGATAAATGLGPALDPKWFHDDLTGNGKGRGLINSHLTPINQPKAPLVADVNGHSKVEIDASHTARVIPVGLTPKVDDRTNWAVLAGHGLLQIPTVDPDWNVHLGLSPQTMFVHYNRDAQGNPSRRLSALYRIELYLGPSSATLTEGELVQGVPALRSVAKRPDEVQMVSLYRTDGVSEAINDLLDHCPVGLQVDADALEKWLDEYSLFDQLCALAEAWNDPASGDLLSGHINSAIDAGFWSVASAAARHLENYGFPLVAYGTINDNLVGTADVQDEIRHQNLNLLMYATLNDLVAVKAQLPVPPVCTSAKPPRASDEQWAATTSVEPLTLVAAGAGSGKTTVIMGRLAHLHCQGIDLNRVTVLSFTNAAAQNVLERNPGVKSKTIAAMILEIYEANHPSHRLSTIETISNSLNIFADRANVDLDDLFVKLLRAVNASSRGSVRASAPLVDLSAFVTANIDWVLGRLDDIGQTCLELTMIVNYLTRETATIPASVTTQYLIVDEVQDTSLYEFAYLMTFARQQQANLFMVGDPSQTLYEFRGTDPRALMILANNPEFVNFSLNTNYRSNQPVLDFANVQLGALETNHGLGIQLRSNSLIQPTEADFRDAVRLHTEMATSESVFVKGLADLTASEVQPFVQKCLDAGEQVAIIAPTRRMVQIMETRLTQLFPKARIDNITSARRVSNVIFSKFIANQWNDVVAIGPTSASLAIVKLIGAAVYTYGPRWGDDQARAKALQEFLSAWWLSQATKINDLVARTTAGMMTDGQFFDALRDLLLQYEIEVNAAAQMALQLRNQMRKQMPGKPDIVVSTIHGVKGLEFDHVVVVNNEAHNSEQTTKRMAYVALTRAKKSELILAFRSTKTSLLQDAHDVLAAMYRRHDVIADARANGVPVDIMTDDELQTLLDDAEAARDKVGAGVKA